MFVIWQFTNMHTIQEINGAGVDPGLSDPALGNLFALLIGSSRSNCCMLFDKDDIPGMLLFRYGFASISNVGQHGGH
jgi:hypothetical protein